MTKSKQLTGRQRAFMSEFLDNYHELGGEPLRYAQVAERLGVSSITAYDMLRVLEKRGMVESQYIVPGRGSGAGRSTIVFAPTTNAEAALYSLSGDDNLADWETRKAHILRTLATHQAEDYQELLDEVLARLPDRENPLLFVTEMITAVLLGLQLAQQDFSSSQTAERLRAAGFPGELGLSALTGLAVALSLTEQANRRLVTVLIAQTKRYPAMLAQVTGSKRDLVHQFIRDALQKLTA